MKKRKRFFFAHLELLKAFAHVPSTLPSSQPKYIAYTFLPQHYPLSNVEQQQKKTLLELQWKPNNCKQYSMTIIKP
jgi:hypothetical protein